METIKCKVWDVKSINIFVNINCVKNNLKVE